MKKTLLIFLFLFPLSSQAQPQARDISFMLDGTYRFFRSRIMDDLNHRYSRMIEDVFPEGIVSREFAEDDMGEDEYDTDFYLLFPRAIPSYISFFPEGNRLVLGLDNGEEVTLGYRVWRDFPHKGYWLEIKSDERMEYYPVGGWSEGALFIKARMRAPINLPFSVGEDVFSFVFEYYP